MATLHFRDEDVRLAELFSRLTYCNPFLPERVACEREILGPGYVPSSRTWNLRLDLAVSNPNLIQLNDCAVALAERLRTALGKGAKPRERERSLYVDLVTYLLYDRYSEAFMGLTETMDRAADAHSHPVDFYAAFRRDWGRFFEVGAWAGTPDPAHLFACMFQVRRAFRLIFYCVIGSSPRSSELRAAAWQSIFTYDMRRYQRSLYNRMQDVPTLITGPSGTGKELIARAVGLARYIPFEAERRSFAENYRHGFFALAIPALSPTLVESELFGHRRGAFTGALEERHGWLEVCGPHGAVFLDEIGDLTVDAQVKLLRVLQTREFQRLGETATRRFEGRIVAATNRDLGALIADGRFRQDLYYRLCADVIRTPSLAELLREAPDDLPAFVEFLARRIAGDVEAPGLTAEVLAWIGQHLPPDYPWPGNVRELEQCVRNILVRGYYQPVHGGASTPDLARDLAAGRLTAEELLQRYCRQVYDATGSYQETARRLGLDRRTVRAKLK